LYTNLKSFADRVIERQQTSLSVNSRQQKTGENLPLTEKVKFKTLLQHGNRIQVPKLVRWQFKMEP